MSEMQEQTNIELIKRHIKSYPDFPKRGIVFQDVFSLLKEPDVFKVLCDTLVQHVKKITPPIQYITALESRGFLFGPIISLQLGVPFAPIRKKGKLPGEISSVSYQLEYGEDVIEIQKDNLLKGKRYLIVDDLLATGGTLGAACQLLEQGGATIAECLIVIELVGLHGRDKISTPVHSLVKIDD